MAIDAEQTAGVVRLRAPGEQEGFAELVGDVLDGGWLVLRRGKKNLRGVQLD